MPRVCIVSPMYHTSFGGVGRQAVALTERLARLGARPFVITRRIRGVPECPLDPDVPVYRVPTLFPRTLNLEGITLVNLLVSWSFTVGLAVLFIWKMRSYDVVHFHGSSLPLIKNILMLRILRKKVIAKVLLGEADVGFVYCSDVTPDIAGQLQQIEVPAPFNILAVYPIAALGEASHPGLADEFNRFLVGPDGQAVLVRWGLMGAGL